MGSSAQKFDAYLSNPVNPGAHNLGRLKVPTQSIAPQTLGLRVDGACPAVFSPNEFSQGSFSYNFQKQDTVNCNPALVSDLLCPCTAAPFNAFNACIPITLFQAAGSQIPCTKDDTLVQYQSVLNPDAQTLCSIPNCASLDSRAQKSNNSISVPARNLPQATANFVTASAVTQCCIDKDSVNLNPRIPYASISNTQPLNAAEQNLTFCAFTHDTDRGNSGTSNVNLSERVVEASCSNPELTPTDSGLAEYNVSCSGPLKPLAISVADYTTGQNTPLPHLESDEIPSVFYRQNSVSHRVDPDATGSDLLYNLEVGNFDVFQRRPSSFCGNIAFDFGALTSSMVDFSADNQAPTDFGSFSVFERASHGFVSALPSALKPEFYEDGHRNVEIYVVDANASDSSARLGNSDLDEIELRDDHAHTQPHNIRDVAALLAHDISGLNIDSLNAPCLDARDSDAYIPNGELLCGDAEVPCGTPRNSVFLSRACHLGLHSFGGANVEVVRIYSSDGDLSSFDESTIDADLNNSRTPKTRCSKPYSIHATEFDSDTSHGLISRLIASATTRASPVVSSKSYSYGMCLPLSAVLDAAVSDDYQRTSSCTERLAPILRMFFPENIDNCTANVTHLDDVSLIPIESDVRHIDSDNTLTNESSKVDRRTSNSDTPKSEAMELGIQALGLNSLNAQKPTPGEYNAGNFKESIVNSVVTNAAVLNGSARDHETAGSGPMDSGAPEPTKFVLVCPETWMDTPQCAGSATKEDDPFKKLAVRIVPNSTTMTYDDQNNTSRNEMAYGGVSPRPVASSSSKSTSYVTSSSSRTICLDNANQSAQDQIKASHASLPNTSWNSGAPNLRGLHQDIFNFDNIKAGKIKPMKADPVLPSSVKSKGNKSEHEVFKSEVTTPATSYSMQKNWVSRNSRNPAAPSPTSDSFGPMNTDGNNVPIIGSSSVECGMMSSSEFISSQLNPSNVDSNKIPHRLDKYNEPTIFQVNSDARNNLAGNRGTLNPGLSISNLTNIGPQRTSAANLVVGNAQSVERHRLLADRNTISLTAINSSIAQTHLARNSSEPVNLWKSPNFCAPRTAATAVAGLHGTQNSSSTNFDRQNPTDPGAVHSPNVVNERCTQNPLSNQGSSEIDSRAASFSIVDPSLGLAVPNVTSLNPGAFGPTAFSFRGHNPNLITSGTSTTVNSAAVPSSAIRDPSITNYDCLSSNTQYPCTMNPSSSTYSQGGQPALFRAPTVTQYLNPAVYRPLSFSPGPLY